MSPIFCLIFSGLQRGVIVSSEPYGLALNETILPEYLNHLGYQSHAVGKVKRIVVSLVNACSVLTQVCSTVLFMAHNRTGWP